MKQIILPESSKRRLVFYLAMEEFVAKELDEEEYFFLWQVNPTVIFGRNQLMESEVNLSYCKQNGIEIYRRKSGGGCVYSDPGNIMLSYITKGEQVEQIFNRYLQHLAALLQQAGAEACVSGRNDILIQDKKVSGNAFYQLPGKSIVHGTLLFNTNLDHLEHAITPSSEKLASKGVISVRQRVTNLQDYINMDIEQFKAYLIAHFCKGERYLTAREITEIEKIEKSYLNESFLTGKNPIYTIIRKRKTRIAGEVELKIDLKNQEIRKIYLTGDFFELQDINSMLNTCLCGVSFTKETVTHALKNHPIKSFILNLSTEEFLNLLFEKT